MAVRARMHKPRRPRPLERGCRAPGQTHRAKSPWARAQRPVDGIRGPRKHGVRASTGARGLSPAGPSGGAAAALTSLALSVAGAQFACARGAAASGLVGEFNASGFVFKDTVSVESFRDPKVDGLALYVTGHRRSVVEKISAADFGDSTQTSIACVASGPVRLTSKLPSSKEGEEIFSERKNLFTKEIKVRRLFDEENDALLYVAYSTRLKGFEDSPTSAKTSVCAVPLSAPAAPEATE